MRYLQATNGSNGSGGGGFFCRSQIGSEGRERHTYGLCNGGCYEEDQGDFQIMCHQRYEEFRIEALAP